MSVKNILSVGKPLSNIQTSEKVTSTKNSLNKIVGVLQNLQKEIKEGVMNNKKTIAGVAGLTSLFALGYFAKDAISEFVSERISNMKESQVEPKNIDIPKHVNKVLNYEISGYSISNTAETISECFQIGIEQGNTFLQAHPNVVNLVSYSVTGVAVAGVAVGFYVFNVANIISKCLGYPQLGLSWILEGYKL